MKAQLLILDFGSQYTQLIARAVRELGVFCEIVPGTADISRIKSSNPKALILSGGPASVACADAPRPHAEVLHLGVPILGICYGMQLVAHEFGGEVAGWGRDAKGLSVGGGKAEDIREFGPARIRITKPIGPFRSFADSPELDVWMSHGDKVVLLPPGFTETASSAGSPVAAFADEARKIYGVQFHPEVHHTPRGRELLSGFLFDVSGLEADWDPASFAEQTIQSIGRKVPTGNVVCGLSGGVDSTVAAVLVSRAIGKRLHCIFVDNGLLRLGEAEEVMTSFKDFGLQVRKIDASQRFLSELSGEVDPEKKRKTIGRVFIEVFQEEARKISDVKYLVQGTLYPDVIESVPVVGESAKIKSHHNVGGLIENMELSLIEPLRELFKDEVRSIGRQLGIEEQFINRQPFPGPGLAVRCLGEITPSRLHTLRIADRIVREEVANSGLETILWQSFAVLLPVQSVGVMGDGRTYEECIAIRAVTSRDGMTADWFMFEEPLLRRMSTRIVNETKGVNRVVLDISTKPPSTIEWE